MDEAYYVGFRVGGLDVGLEMQIDWAMKRRR
ncbi:MAG: hypothetical protein QOD62_2961 [Actinomycetota bacterium]|jgi:hypothetical protein|nr:hypothetical protein [Actinomycetota bacterium]